AHRRRAFVELRCPTLHSDQVRATHLPGRTGHVGRFVRSQILHRPSRPVALGVGILVAALTFTLLTSADTTSALEIRGTVQQNFRSAYDIIVRPVDSYTQM